MVIGFADDHATTCVRRHTECNGAMPIDMIQAKLRIVFDHQDQRVFPELRVRDPFYNPTQGKIVIRHHRAWRRIVRRSSVGMIARQYQHTQGRHLAGSIEICQIIQEDGSALLV